MVSDPHLCTAVWYTTLYLFVLVLVLLPTRMVVHWQYAFHFILVPLLVHRSHTLQMQWTLVISLLLLYSSKNTPVNLQCVQVLLDIASCRDHSPHCFSIGLRFSSLAPPHGLNRKLETHVLSLAKSLRWKWPISTFCADFFSYRSIYSSSFTVQGKQNVPSLCAGVWRDLRVAMLTEAAHTMPSLTCRQASVDFREAQVPFYISRRKSGLNRPWLERAACWIKQEVAC